MCDLFLQRNLSFLLQRNRHQLNCGIGMGIGGTFNFLAGKVKRAPQWMDREVEGVILEE